MKSAELDTQTIPQGVIVEVASRVSRIELHDFGDFKRLTLTMLDGQEFQYDSHDCGFHFDDAVARLTEAAK